MKVVKPYAPDPLLPLPEPGTLPFMVIWKALVRFVKKNEPTCIAQRAGSTEGEPQIRLYVAAARTLIRIFEDEWEKATRPPKSKS